MNIELSYTSRCERSRQISKILEKTHEPEGRIYSQLSLKFSDPDACSINKRFSDLETDANHSFNSQ